MTTHLVRITTALAAVATAAGLIAVAPAAARPDDGAVTSVRLGQLDRGPGPAVPRVVGTSIVEGDRAVAVDADEVQLLGTSGGEYVASIYSAGGSSVERVAADGTRTVVLDRVPFAVALSGDGTQLVTTRPRGTRRTVVAVRDATTGERVARHTFGAGASVLDADEGRVVVGQTGPARTLSWHVDRDRVTRISDRTGYAADISADRLAAFTAPLYEGGCSVLTRLSTPRRATWRSCERAVLAFSPDGRRTLTTNILMDGPLGQVEVHTARGRRVAAYRSGDSFGVLGWEDARTALVTVYDRRGRSALVRCHLTDCERASDVVAP
jgi:hypothetical protein